jgi:uncharacterized protein YndB with AHSA1/START domain
MVANSESLVLNKQKTVSIKRTINLPPDKVWKAWTDADTFKKWWGPKSFTCPSCTIDLKVGGKYLACMKAPDGKEYWSTGYFREIVPMKKIVYTDSFSDDKGNVIPASELDMPGEWPLELLVTLEFENVDGITRLSLQQTGIPEEAYDDCVKGWQESFDKMESNLK